MLWQIDMVETYKYMTDIKILHQHSSIPHLLDETEKGFWQFGPHFVTLVFH